jgi:hypothetical protein
MATLDELVDRAYRDLADEGKEVFSTLQVEDFIRGGIADLNRAAPQDTYEDVVLVTDPDTGVVLQYAYDIGILQPYRVESRRISDGYISPLPNGEDEEGGQVVGWTFRSTATGGTIEFPRWWFSPDNGFDSNNYTIRVIGYGARPLPYTVEGDPSPEVPLSDSEEYSVRAFAKQAGFDLLSHDRSLFAQWQGQTNNTDVSPTQMLQLTSQAKSEWRDQRGLIRVVRRYW